MLLLWSPPLPPPVVPRLLRRASRWPPRAGPREQGPGRRAPSPPGRVRVQPPPAAGDAATSRLSISRGSAAKLPRLPPKVGAHLSRAGAERCAGGSRARGGTRQRGAGIRRCGPSGAWGYELAARGRGKGQQKASATRLGSPVCSPRARKIVPPWAVVAGGLGRRRWALWEERPSRLSPAPPRARSLLSPPSAQLKGRGYRGRAPLIPAGGGCLVSGLAGRMPRR